MTTDTEIRAAFRAAVPAEIAGLTADPALLTSVRRQHRRDRRLVMVGAPLGVAVLAAGSVVGVTTLADSRGGAATIRAGDQPGSGGPHVVLLGHVLDFPAGWTVRQQTTGVAIDATTHVGRGEASASLADRGLRQNVDLIVYRHPIGSTAPAGQGTVQPQGTVPRSGAQADGDGNGAKRCGRITVWKGKAHHVSSHQHLPGPPDGTTPVSVGSSHCDSSPANVPEASAQLTLDNGDLLLAVGDNMTDRQLQHLLRGAQQD